MTRSIGRLGMELAGAYLRLLRSKAVTKLEEMRHPENAGLGWWAPGTAINYDREIGTGLQSNVLMTPISYIGRVSAEARMCVKTEASEGEDLDHEHPSVVLIKNPNRSYSGSSLMFATRISRFLDGNAYWLKVRGTGRKVRELWYAPHWMIEPMHTRGSSQFVDFYRYTYGSGHADLAPEDVVHFRFGIDPEDVRKGYSPLKSVLREAFMDSEASNFVAALLRNKGIPGLVISPEKGVDVSEADRNTMKEYVKSQFTGDKRFSTLTMGAATKVQSFGFNPQELDLSSVHNLSEERVCALIGLPAAVVGFGSGMEQTKVGATAAELRKQAWTDCIIPTQDSEAEDITRSLLIPDFGGVAGRHEFMFDRSNVAVLQDDLDVQSQRLERGVRGGWTMISEAREAQGLPVNDSHKVFLRPLGAIEVSEDGEEVFREGGQETQPELAPGSDPAEPEDLAPPKEAKEAKRLSRMQARLARGMDRVKRRMRPAMVKSMRGFLDRFGKAVEKAWLEIGKVSDDALHVEELFTKVDIVKQESEMRAIFGAHYVAVHQQVVAVAAGMGLGINLPDIAETQVLHRGGRRAGLVDLSRKARVKVFDVLEEGREQGWGVAKIAKVLREQVPAGPWLSPKTRAEVIARTETAYAQVNSAIDVYEATEGATAAQMLDARLGPTDAECESIDGMIVSFDVARQLIEMEHPNGTRDMVPYFGDVPDNALI